VRRLELVAKPPDPVDVGSATRIDAVAKDAGQFRCEDGILADVAPTLLFLLGMEKPKEMTGRNLLVNRG